MTAVISSKGRIALPAKLRATDGIKAGEKFKIKRIKRGEYLLVRRRSWNKGLTDWLLACPAKVYFVPIESESSNARRI
jgi:AbrB family looped-hinge helix DNA binding protein